MRAQEGIMRIRSITMLALSAAAATFAVPASAVVCYTVLEADNSVIYRGYEPPVDLSAAGAAEREAMRRRGQFFMISSVDDCLLVAPSRWTTGGAASVDEIVSDMRPFASGAPSGTPTSVTGATSVAPPPQRAAPAAPTMRSGSTSQRGGY